MKRNYRRKPEAKNRLSLFISKARKQRFSDQFKSYFRSHYQSFVSTIRRLCAEPLQTLMTSLVVAIALGLPLTLYVGVINLKELGSHAESTTQITVFLKMTASQLKAEKLKKSLLSDIDITAVKYISSQQGLDEFRLESNFGSVLEMLDENPLPAVLLIQPKEDIKHDSEAIGALVRKLQEETLVDSVQVDMQWLQRLQAMLEVCEKLALMLGVVLAFSVLLIIGNTVRLALENRRNEVIVVKLVGGTDSYVRRPFLYTGAWYGFMGGALAWILVTVFVHWMSAPVAHLADLYQSVFQLEGLGSSGLMWLLLIGAGLGLLGAWLAIVRQLASIEPK